KPVSSVISAAPKKPNDAYSAPGTTGPASAYTHATSQPKNEPRPRLTHVYMPPADVIRLLNWLIEYAVNRHAMSANRTASGVIAPANVVANPTDSAAATAGAMNVID